MRVAIVEVPYPGTTLFYRDWAGGFGTCFKVGRSLRARLIEAAKRGGVSLPQLYIGYAASILRQGVSEVFFTKTLPSEPVDYALIASSIINYKEEIKYAQLIKKRWGARIGFFGPFAGNRPELFAEAADFIIKGEPEAAFMELASGAYLQGEVESPPVDDLDSLPFPEWDMFNVKKFSYFPNLTRKPVLPVLGSRGCPYKCNYCAYRANYKFRMRSSENVVDELEYLKKIYKIKGVIFRDPIFTLNRKRSEDIADMMLRRNLGLHWGCETHMSDLDTELIDTLYESGLRSINVGIESSSEEVIKASTRFPYDSAAHQEMIIRYCDKKGIRVTAFYILGLLNDSEETVKKTIEYAKYLDTHTVSFNLLAPYPGTEFYEQVKNIIVEDYEKFTSFDPVIEHPNISQEKLSLLREEAFVSYYFRLKYIGNFIRRILK